jgi:alpha-ketoglutarate-dependent taurine dioxygenase
VGSVTISSAVSYAHIEVRPVSGALGAEVFGVDLSKLLENAVCDEIRRAFLEHAAIFFRDQQLSPEAQLALARRFGKPDIQLFASMERAYADPAGLAQLREAVLGAAPGPEPGPAAGAAAREADPRGGPAPTDLPQPGPASGAARALLPREVETAPLGPGLRHRLRYAC